MKRKRRIILYSLAGFLLVAVAVLAVLVYSALEWKREYDRLFQITTARHVYLEYYTTDLQYPIWLGWLLGDVLAVDLFGYREIRGVTITLMEYPHTDLEFIGTLTRLERITIERSRERSRLTAGQFSHLKGLKTLKKLSLRGTSVDDSVLEIVGTFENLKSLDLRGTQITNTGVTHLARLTNLERLDLWNANVTSMRIAELRKTLPNCTITGP